METNEKINFDKNDPRAIAEYIVSVLDAKKQETSSYCLSPIKL